MMDAKTFKRFRRMMGFNQNQMANLLGMSRDAIQRRERGTMEITQGDCLACAALAMGIRDYNGPAPDVDYDQKRKRREKR